MSLLVAWLIHHVIALWLVAIVFQQNRSPRISVFDILMISLLQYTMLAIADISYDIDILLSYSVALTGMMLVTLTISIFERRR